MKIIRPIIFFFLVTISFYGQSQTIMRFKDSMKYLYTDSIISIELCVKKQTKDSSMFKLAINAKPNFAIAIKEGRVDIFKTKKQDSVVALIWIATPDIHTTEYDLRVFKGRHAFTKNIIVSNIAKTMSLGIQLVLVRKEINRKWLRVPNDMRPVIDAKTIWLNHISTTNKILHTQ